MKSLTSLAVLCAALLVGCGGAQRGDSAAAAARPSAYFDSSGRDDVLSGGVRMIPIDTPKGTFRVWTKRVGNNPRIKVLLLHGLLHCLGYDHEADQGEMERLERRLRRTWIGEDHA